MNEISKVSRSDESIRNLKAVKFALGQLGSNDRIMLAWNSKCAEQGYRLCRIGKQVHVEASDEVGMMYGILELAECTEYDLPEREWVERTPFIKNRGIKFNIPLDARTPSYSDASDSAFENIPQVWEWEFWTKFLDEMALHRYNVLSLWSLSPFPSLVRIPEYPAIALEDVKRSTVPPLPEMSGANMYASDMEIGLYTVKKMTITEKIAFWKKVMEYAKNRGITVYLFLWNLFVYGTENNPYGITCDQNNPVTADYIYCAVKTLLDTYPLLGGLGVTAGENMVGDDTDIPFLRQTYARAVEDYLKEHPGRKFSYIHRMQYARFDEIMDAYRDFEGEFYISFKYAQAHMHAFSKPAFFENFRKKHPEDVRYWFTLRDDDYYLYRWGDISYARQFIRQMPVEMMEGFYMGADGFTWGRDYTAKQENEHPLYLEKMWYKFDIWGRLAFNPDCSEISFFRKLECKLGISDGLGFAKLWAQASGIIARLHCTHWHDYDFQWYPEGCCMFLHPPVAKLVFADILEFMDCPAMPGTPYLSVKEFVTKKESSVGESPYSPLATVREIRCNVLAVEEKLQGEWHIERGTGKEYENTWKDIKALTLLGAYYADKLDAAISLCRFKANPSQIKEGERGLELLKKAAAEWKTYSAWAMAIYRPQRLTRLRSYVDFRMFDRAAQLDIELAVAMVYGSGELAESIS